MAADQKNVTFAAAHCERNCLMRENNSLPVPTKSDMLMQVLFAGAT